MSRLENKTNNEILIEIKQLEMNYDSLKTSMVKDLDLIEELKEKMKKEWLKLEQVEASFMEANDIILKRLKGNG
jgi:hypothetical protein